MSEPTDIKIIPSLSWWSTPRFTTWFALSIQLELAPWFWRVGFYSAYEDGHFLLLYLGPLRIHLYA